MEDVLIRFRLVGDEARALRELSAHELRSPREQIRFVVRKELERRGLLPKDESQSSKEAQ